MSWRRFRTLLGGLTAKSRWMRAVARAPEREVRVLEGDAAEAYFATWGG